MNLNDFATEAHQIAVDHGFWDNGKRNVGEMLMLGVSELVEALEEDRSGNPDLYFAEDGKPEGFAIEVMDCMIRCGDLLRSRGHDLNNLAQLKMKYNARRDYMHGGRKY